MKERIIFLASLLFLWGITFLEVPRSGWFLGAVNGNTITSISVPKKACEGILEVPYKYPTIQAALDAACAGGTVRIGPGTFSEAVIIGMPHSGVKIVGAGADSTILKGDSSRSISMDSAKDISIQNLTIKGSGGYKFDGGGLWISRSSNIAVENCRISDNRANRGAGVAVTHGSLVDIKNCLIDNNISQSVGSGILIENSSRVNLENVSIADNQSSTLCYGLGLYAEGADAVLKNSVIWGNSNVDKNSCYSVNHLYAVRQIVRSDIEGGFSGKDNFNVNPFFYFSSEGDYLISTTSNKLLINTGARPYKTFVSSIISPIIYRIEAWNVTTAFADILWRTDKLSDTIIYYTTTYPLQVVKAAKATGAGNTRSHRVSLSGLSEGTNYYFIIVSKDSMGNTATSTEYSFNTIPIPKVSGGSSGSSGGSSGGHGGGH